MTTLTSNLAPRGSRIATPIPGNTSVVPIRLAPSEGGSPRLEAEGRGRSRRSLGASQLQASEEGRVGRDTGPAAVMPVMTGITRAGRPKGGRRRPFPLLISEVVGRHQAAVYAGAERAAAPRGAPTKPRTDGTNRIGMT